MATKVLGRDDETADAVARIRERRLVTITGPGGIGKTALAQAAAAIVGGEFEYGAITVDLTRVDDSAGVYEAIAGQLGYADFESLMNSPSDQPALIVIDNCEHVLDAAAEATARMLEACRMPTILTTSRAPLDLPDESIVTLGPLPVPSGDDDIATPAMLLLLERIRDQGVEVGDTDLSVHAEICRRLDGVPLAIELAAARLRAVTPADLLRELEERPHRLGRRRYRGQASHRSVSEMVRWSSDLLTAEARTVFSRLGVFAGPFTAPMAAGVGDLDPADIDEVIDELVASSLVVVDASSTTTRYRLLHPVRAVALELLDDAGELYETRGRFVDQVVRLAIDVIGRATSGWGSDVLNELIAMYDNITTSLRWLLANDDEPERALTLLAVLWGVVHQAHTAEIAELGEATLDRWNDTSRPLWPDAAATVATCRSLLRDYDGALELAESTLPIADVSPFAPATLRRLLAQTHRILGDLPRSCELFHEGARVAAERGVHGFSMELRVDEGMVRAELGDTAAGLELVDDAATEATKREAPINQVWAEIGRGSVLLWQDPSAAVTTIVDALDHARAIDYPAGRSCGLRLLAEVRLATGDDAGSAAALLDLIDELLGRGGLNDLRLVLDLAAELFERFGDARWADLAATAGSMPITTVLAPLDPPVISRAATTGQPMSVRDAYRSCRDVLGRIAGGRMPSPEPDLPGETADGISPEAEIASEGDVWRITYDGRTIRLKRSKGLIDLAVLLARPGVEVSCLDLMGSQVSAGATEDEVLDPAARRAYEERVRELQSDLEDAETANDIGRAERLQIELDAIIEELTAAVGLGGRSRRTSGSSERARSAVTQRLRSTIRRIARDHPSLGSHLGATVTTGTFCSYRPPPDAAPWNIDT